MESKWKIWLGLIIAMVIVFSVEKYYFDLGFFEQTGLGFAHDTIVFLFGITIWAMFGLLGFYKGKR